MKKLFTVLVASICGTMAYAQSGAISVNDVTVMKGATTQVEVAINDAANMTAFQFDLAVPAGFSVTDAKLNGEYGESRHLLNGEVGGKLRFLSYDDGNAKLLEGEKVIVTLEATEEAETATLTGDGIVVVDPEGNSVGAEDLASASINVSDGVKVTIGQNEITTLVSDKDLDFSGDDVKAYIAIGYDNNDDVIFLTRVKDVPKNTPILLMGKQGEYTIPVTNSQTYYPENFLKGSATEAVAVDNSGKYLNMRLKDGVFQKLEATTFQAKKCYLQVPAPETVTSTVGDAFKFTMGKNGTKSYTGKYDLDFTGVEGLTAYVVTGYDKNGTVKLSRAKKVSCKTPLVLLGDANKEFEVPSTAQKVTYVNMLRGDADNATTIQKKTDDGWTNLILKSGQFVGLSVESTEMAAGTSYLPIPTSFIPATSRGEFANGLIMEEVEVITLKALGGGDDDATGISRIAAEAGNDTWYNLKGQRIDKPTRKGLYIKNGKKVIVK